MTVAHSHRSILINLGIQHITLVISQHIAPVEILFGYLNPDNFNPINTIILITKAYIFSKSRKAIPLDISELKSNIRQVYDEQQYMALMDMKQETFNKKLGPSLGIYFAFKSVK